MELTDNIWKTLEGGYRTIYDVSMPLQKLLATNDEREIDKIWEELWNELHHQGDVGLASYLSLPQLVQIGKLKNLYNLNLLSLCCIIEQQRHLGNNPVIPPEFLDYYENGLKELKLFVLNNLNNNLDDATYAISVATLATCNGQIELGKAILELEDKDILNEFIEQF
ncbi:hypothetical protein [Pedobacter frigiditerrae]|uniref:hypothetical protein n=1 Tax=Pedobacter frigiditerrae TaxID=2530452 RepID=UPI00292E0F12|nr:hypothetical protein [Pedobacter frigiditerrae]